MDGRSYPATPAEEKRENEAEMKSIGPILFVGCLFESAARLESLGNVYVVSRS